MAPTPDGGYCIGATFQHNDPDAALRIADQAKNLSKLESLLPGFASHIDASKLHGRVAWRSTTSDRLPIYGAIHPNLYVSVGLGARGLVWASLGAEILAARICNEPWPLDRKLVQAISPDRYQ